MDMRFARLSMCAEDVGPAAHHLVQQGGVSCTVMHAVWLGLAPVELSGQAGDLYRFRIGVRKLCANC